MLAIQKIMALTAPPELQSNYINLQIRKLLSKIDVLFTLQNNHINAETEAYKKLHKFQLLNNIAKALLELKACENTSPLFLSI